MQYGEYIRYLLSEKKVKLTELTDKIDIKSRNELYRLFENIHSYDKSKELIDKIVSVIDFSDTEKAEIYSRLENGNTKKSYLKSRRILGGIYDGEIYKADEELYLNFAGEEITAADKADIYISGVYSEKWIGVLDRILKENPKARISHFVSFSGKEEDVAFEIAAIIALSTHENYNAYTVRKPDRSEAIAFIVKKGKMMMGVAQGCGRDERFLKTNIETDLYEFIKEDFEKQKTHPIKELSDKLSDYSKELNRWSEEYRHPTLLVSGGIHFCEIPFDILFESFRDAGFFGLPEKNEFTQDIIRAYQKRCDLEKEFLNQKRMIFDKETMAEFIDSGRTIDHMYCFRSLTPAERLRVLKEFVSDCEKYRENRRFRFLKNKVTKQMIYIDGKLLSTFNPYLGYGKGHYIIDIRKANVASVCKDFTEYMWENKTYGEAESMQIMKEMIKEAEGKYEYDI